MQKEFDNQIALNILNQLGGKRFVLMTGATNLGYTKDSLTMKIGRNEKGVTHCKIVLDASDTYTVTFFKIRGTKTYKVLSETSDIYNDSLQSHFTDKTGMLLTL